MPVTCYQVSRTITGMGTPNAITSFKWTMKPAPPTPWVPCKATRADGSTILWFKNGLVQDFAADGSLTVWDVVPTLETAVKAAPTGNYTKFNLSARTVEWKRTLTYGSTIIGTSEPIEVPDTEYETVEELDKPDPRKERLYQLYDRLEELEDEMRDCARMEYYPSWERQLCGEYDDVKAEIEELEYELQIEDGRADVAEYHYDVSRREEGY